MMCFNRYGESEATYGLRGRTRGGPSLSPSESWGVRDEFGKVGALFISAETLEAGWVWASAIGVGASVADSEEGHAESFLAVFALSLDFVADGADGEVSRATGWGSPGEHPLCLSVGQIDRSRGFPLSFSSFGGRSNARGRREIGGMVLALRHRGRWCGGGAVGRAFAGGVEDGIEDGAEAKGA